MMRIRGDLAWKVLDFTFAILCIIPGIYYADSGEWILSGVYLLSSAVCALSGWYGWGRGLSMWILSGYTRILRRLAIMGLLRRGL